MVESERPPHKTNTPDPWIPVPGLAGQVLSLREVSSRDVDLKAVEVRPGWPAAQGCGVPDPNLGQQVHPS